MTDRSAIDVAGVGDPHAPERPSAAWLRESTGWLALEATRRTYAAQPDLWALGEQGRARTLEDFTHHLHAVVPGDEAHWREHLRYCVTLFDARGFPQRWLTEAFATLDAVLRDALPEELTREARSLLDRGAELMAEVATDAGIDLDRPTRYDQPGG